MQMSFGMQACVGPKKHVLHVDAQWRHLANTIESAMCVGDAASCHITLTTCYGRPT